MKRLFYPLLFSILILSSCSTGKKALQRGDYYDAISKAVERLQSDPENRNSIQVIEEGYSSAIQYYQEEIDLTLTGNDRFKWGKAVEIMDKVNKLSEQIRKVPAARKLISDPKTYISEMRPAKEKAAGELYPVALELMKSGNKDDARQAYLYFVKTDQMIPGYQDANRMIIESKKRATYTVIVEQIPAFSELYNLSAVSFYDRVLGMLKYSYPEKSFVNFYSEADAGNFRIEHPDMILKMSFSDFHIGTVQHNESEQPLSKAVEERVKVSKKDSVYFETKYRNYKGTIKTMNDQVLTEGLLKYEIFDFQANNNVIMSERIPGNFLWNNAYAIFVGDREVLDSKQTAMLNNRFYPMPSPQDLFAEFSKPVFNQLSNRLQTFFRKYEK